jgi:hypothetical protein
MPNVYNKHRSYPANALYIGRGSPFGNPFKIGQHGTRDEVCAKYEALVENDPELKAAFIKACRGRDLVCYCKPARCHGDYLLRISNESQ